MSQAVLITNRSGGEVGNNDNPLKTSISRRFTGHQSVNITGDGINLIPKIDTNRTAIKAINLSQTYDMFLGTSAVTSGDGYPLFMQTGETFEIHPDDNFYVRLAAGTGVSGDLRILEYK